MALVENIKVPAESVKYESETVDSALDGLKSYTSTGATVPVPFKDRAGRALYSDDFGSPGTDTGTSINQALDYLNTSGDAFAKGGTVHVPRGPRTVNTTVLLDRTAGGADTTESFVLEGEGAGTSELRAGSGLSPVSAIIKTNEPDGKPVQIYRLSDLCTRGGYNGLRVETASRGCIERLKIDNATNDGAYFGNTWVNYINGLLVNNAGGNGVNFDPARQKTSTVTNASYVNKSVGDAWVWGFMNYSAAIGVAADAAGLNGHHIKNSEGFVMLACGNEGARRAGIFAEASSAIGNNRSISIIGHFSHNSNLANGSWANLLHARSLNGADNRISIRDSTSDHPNFGMPDIVADGVGTIIINDNNITPNGVRTYNGGYIDHVHHTLLVNNLSVTAAVPVCKLGSTQGHTTNLTGESSCFAGTIKILASTLDPSNSTRRLAMYELLVCVTQEQGKECVVTHSAGYLSGNVPGAPSFTWSINQSNRLVATPIANASGSFWFEITTDSQVVATPL